MDEENPSRIIKDRTELNAQIEAFLASGGEIKRDCKNAGDVTDWHAISKMKLKAAKNKKRE